MNLTFFTMLTLLQFPLLCLDISTLFPLSQAAILMCRHFNGVHMFHLLFSSFPLKLYITYYCIYYLFTIFLSELINIPILYS